MDKPKSKPAARTVALVTGTLAAPQVRAVARTLRDSLGTDAHVIELNIQVAALMTGEWVDRKLALPPDARFDRIILPGYCRGEVDAIERRLGTPVVKGPRDVRDLPEMFDARVRAQPTLDEHRIEIIAEINDAAHLSPTTIFDLADRYRADGADVIDLGCDPQADRPAWRGVGDLVRELKARGHRVSVDSFHIDEVRRACEAGAELVLSVNSTNRDAAADFGAEVVAIPDTPDDLSSLDGTIDLLEKRGVRYRIDPIIEPIGFGFAASLGRYLEVRRRHPQAAMMMGIGNLSEMTEVDAAGVNMLLIGFCAEQRIDSVLTTQVINWARSSVREIDLARRIMHHAVTHHTVPKHLDDRLVMLRDAKLHAQPRDELNALAAKLTDRNMRLFAADGLLHAMNKDWHVTDGDAFALFRKMLAGGLEADASHAFYLGYELAKAVIAMTLSKNYTQDEALRFGMLTRDEVSHHDGRQSSQPTPDADKPARPREDDA